MSERKQAADVDSEKIREIDASIAEGKLMLQVLRSLPKSENNDAFISRFEELVSRLEDYKSQGKPPEDSHDVQNQINALKEKQENIRRILDQTAHEFQNSLSATTERASSSAASANKCATDLLSEFKSLITSASLPTTADGDHANRAKSDESANHRGETEKRGESNLAVEDTSENSDQKDSKSLQSGALASLVWLSQFSMQRAKLDDLMEDTKRFQSMVERLTDITKRAHLSQATGFLIDISTRFEELWKSFDSLRESYKDIQSEKNIPDELRAAQLTGLQDVLTTLDRNLEGTKECFFTTYHLVKSSVEQGVADGSLRETISDPEDESRLATAKGTVSQGDEHEQQLTKSAGENDSSAIAKPDLSGLSPGDTLEAQKAYLVALQGKTATEREEIARLLRQRDELTARLNQLKATAMAMSQNQQTAPVGEAIPETDERTDEVESPRACSPGPDLEPIMLAHLEAKKRELVQLKAQLELFKKAEERMAALQLDDQNPPEAEIPKSSAVKSGSRSRQTRSHRPSPPLSNNLFKARFLDSIIHENGTVISGRNESDPQQPEPTCIRDNTERLYENMREARIRLEEQRGHGTSGGTVPGTGITAVLSATGKTALSGGAASVATSQDRTTLATWGGSSSTGSSSASNSIDGPADDAAGITVTSTSQLMTTLTNGIGSSSKKVQDAQISERRSRCKLGDKHSGTPMNGLYVSDDVDLLDPNSLPQLGRSPSPPGCTLTGASQTGISYMGVTQPAGGASTDEASPAKAGVSMTTVGTDREFCPSAYCSSLGERVQHLETSVAYLYQACRNLLLQNTQLHTAVVQLLSHAHTAAVAAPPSNPFGSMLLSHNAVPPTSRLVLQSPVSHSVVPPSDAASTVSSVRGTHQFVPPSVGVAESRPNAIQREQRNAVQQQMTLHLLMQHQAQKFNEMEQLLQQFNQHKSMMSSNHVAIPPHTGTALSSQLISPVTDSVGHVSSSLLLQPAYSIDASAAFGLTQPTTVLTAPQWPYRTTTLPASAGLVQTSIATWPNEFYAGLRPTSVPTSALYVPPAPTVTLDPYANLVSPQPSGVSTSRSTSVVNPATGQADMLSQLNRVWISPDSNVSGHGPG